MFKTHPKNQLFVFQVAPGDTTQIFPLDVYGITIDYRVYETVEPLVEGGFRVLSSSSECGTDCHITHDGAVVYYVDHGQNNDGSETIVVTPHLNQPQRGMVLVVEIIPMAVLTG